MRFIYNIRLNLFDGGATGTTSGSGDGAEVVAGTANGTTTGVTNSEKKAGVTPTPRSRRNTGVYDNVKFGKQPTAEGVSNGQTVNDPVAEDVNSMSAEAETKVNVQMSREERRRAYDKYIKGEGKEFYAEDTQQIISKRIKDHKSIEEKLEKLQPFMDALGDKYNLAPDDLEGLMKAIQGDRDFFIDAATEAGMDNPETYREFREAQRKNKAYEDAQKAQQKATQEAERQSFVQQKTAEWQAEAKAVKGKYPSFNFEGDMQNPQFASMLRAGVSIEAAYRALHHDEILAGEIANAKSLTEKTIVDNIRAKGTRPIENGTSNSSTFTYKSDPSKFTKADRAEIAKRVARGEVIEL